MKDKKYATYAEESFVMIKIMKVNLNKKKSEIIVITQENLEELLIIFVFKIQSTKKYSSSIS